MGVSDLALLAGNHMTSPLRWEARKDLGLPLIGYSVCASLRWYPLPHHVKMVRWNQGILLSSCRRRLGFASAEPSENRLLHSCYLWACFFFVNRAFNQSSTGLSSLTSSVFHQESIGYLNTVSDLPFIDKNRLGIPPRFIIWKASMTLLKPNDTVFEISSSGVIFPSVQSLQASRNLLREKVPCLLIISRCSQTCLENGSASSSSYRNVFSLVANSRRVLPRINL